MIVKINSRMFCCFVLEVRVLYVIIPIRVLFRPVIYIIRTNLFITSCYIYYLLYICSI
ncbi:hypothetical protein C2G38_1315611 [Gigaspora rosea]|uniref:Uncharacterized protein n=1 Tax=Gigaspora rosea TaxID=44941 RepID=A0A397VB12_9GLOM|nr:hypothetical protein C2G38_1315611 [Gigaspora rosea]